MSFLKKIQKVLAMLSPWAAAKPVKRTRRAKKKSKKVTRKINQREFPQTKKIVRKVEKKQPRKKIKDKPKVKTVVLKNEITKKTKKAAPAKKLKAGTISKLALKPVKLKRVLVGEVTHYFDRVKVAAFMVTGAPIVLGDALEFEGKWGAFRQEIKSLQMDRVPVKSARAGDEVGLLVKKPVHEGDYVFKVL